MWFHEPVVIVLDVTKALVVPPDAHQTKAIWPVVVGPNPYMAEPRPGGGVVVVIINGYEAPVLNTFELAREAKLTQASRVNPIVFQSE
jgi:hypothetical protein